jgi:hypothetical protein
MNRLHIPGVEMPKGVEHKHKVMADNWLGDLKKPCGEPVRPGALSEGRTLITDHTSSSLKRSQMSDKSVRRKSSCSSFMQRALDGGVARMLLKKSGAASALASSDTAKRSS